MPTAWSSPMIVTTEVWDPTTRQHFAQQQPFKPAKTTRPGVPRTPLRYPEENAYRQEARRARRRAG